ncbi:tol-pal system protein YbgF [Aliisedimentitalea scapharcae]|uniref:Cell division coordinator CpoB n=1 Tax=Aliisedimentitalea scapharcae TaxID=1524259 RepID=A0ABZ2XXF6_9RHOB
MRTLALAVIFSVFSAGTAVQAQDQQTLADIRQELTVLHVEIQRLKRELSTTGAPSTNLSGTSVLERVNAIETELQRLTSQTEQLDYRIKRVVADGTNRIGDLEFRLVELEGGDVSTLGETSTLGGVTDAPSGTTVAPPTGGTIGGELAVGEKADFDAARAALENGDYQTAVSGFAAFDQAYPGSPLAATAHLLRGQALDGIGDTREAARAYLASFTRDSTGATAPQALVELGAALGRLGQTEQACVTLGEVRVRFPVSDAVAKADQELTALGCS